jgi:endonuclease/exonuclease/phosphatase family metal-dependent hydrolase
MKKVLLIVCLSLGHWAAAQPAINAMFYNLYRFPDNPPANRELILKEITNEYRPDLLMVCELVREQGADHILNTALQTSRFNFARAAFVPDTSNLSDPLQQMVFYNLDKLMLIAQRTLATRVRNINHYTFVLNTKDLATDSVFLDVFVTHLKSSEGKDNERARLHMIDTFVKALKTIPKGHHVLLAGDFNFYSAYTEPAYTKILDSTNAVVMLDPIHKPGNWSNNDTFKDIHTQATRTSSAGFGIGGATGGLDDRFDFIMMSESLLHGDDLRYVPGTYRAYGNNGNCYNQRIDHYDCDGGYGIELRRNLYNMSDHLPVVMKFSTGKQFLSIPETHVSSVITFPSGNIATEFLQVKFGPDRKIKETILSIYNSLGQKVRTIYPVARANSLSIYTGDLSPGVYYLNVTGENRTTVKFLKQ